MTPQKETKREPPQPRCPNCKGGRILIDWDKGNMSCTVCQFEGDAKQFFGPSAPQPQPELHVRLHAVFESIRQEFDKGSLLSWEKVDPESRFATLCRFCDAKVGFVDKKCTHVGACPVLHLFEIAKLVNTGWIATSTELKSTVGSGDEDHSERKSSCKWCDAGNIPELSPHTKTYIHRRDTLDMPCTNPRCPQCGVVATYQTPDGTLWCDSAHSWKESK